ncbi:hypothetical protein ACWEPH_26940 [Nocardia beijingensis]
MGRSTSHRNAYEWWTDERNLELVELLRTELTLAEIADRTGRSVTAVEAQIRNLIPAELRVNKRDAEQVLRGLLRSADYDWRTWPRDRARRARQVYWDSDMNDTLRQGWEQMRPLQELTEALAASELEIARQLMRLGVAENSREVAERLGCDPAGTLAGRLRLAEDRAAGSVWVLVVDGARGTERITLDEAEPRGHHRHVSVHVDYDTADLALNDILNDHATAGGDLAEVTATIAERAVGDLGIGTTTHSVRAVNNSELVDLDQLDIGDDPFAAAQPEPEPGVTSTPQPGAFAGSSPRAGSDLDTAIATARRDVEFRDHVEQSRQHYQAEFTEEINKVLAEAAEQFRTLDAALRLVLVRPKRRLERATNVVADTVGGRYVVLDEHRCWILPPNGRRGASAHLVFTEHGGLFWVGWGSHRIISEDPTALVVTDIPRSVDARTEFEPGHWYDAYEAEGPRSAVIRTLRNALAQSFVEYERAIRNSEPIADLFQKHPIQWRR